MIDEDFDEADPDTPIEYPIPSKDEIKEQLIEMWFDCLRLNEDYKSYCKAKRKKDATACQRFEKQFPFIAELYGDWGDIYVDDSGYVSLETWMAGKRHLFFEPEIELHASIHSQLRANEFAISIPRGLEIRDLKSKFKSFLEKNQETLCASFPRSAPKYRLRKSASLRTLTTLRRAEFVSRLLGEEVEFFSDRENKIVDYKYSYSRVARSILGNRKIRIELGFEGRAKKGKTDIWASTPELNLLMLEPEVAADEFDSYKSDIGMWVNYYRACIKSAIDGKFPAKAEVEEL